MPLPAGIDRAKLFKNLPAILIIGALVAYYPIAVIAYQAYQAPIRRARLEADLRLLFGEAKAQTAIDKARLGDYYGKINFFLHVLLAMLVTCAAAVFLFAVPEGIVPEKSLEAMRYGFLGTYVFAAQLIYRRYSTFDLQPAVFMSCTVTMVAGLSFNYVAFAALGEVAAAQDGTNTVTTGLFAILAFSLGYFPTLAIRWFNRLAFAALGVKAKRKNEKPLTMIDGVSQFHANRLRDIGIDNVQNLAAADIPALLLNTTFSAQQVIDWIDQAILILYLEDSAVDSFRQAGVRTLADFQAQWDDIHNQGEPDFDAWALQFQSTMPKLKLLYHSTRVGPNAHYVANYWLASSKIAELQAGEELLRAQERLLEIAGDVRGNPQAAAEIAHADKAQLQKAIDQVELQGLEDQFFDEGTVLGAGAVLEADENFDRAAGIYSRYLEAYPDSVPVMNALAFLYLSRGEGSDHEQALALATRVLELAQSNGATALELAAYHDTLGTACLELGDLPAARREFDEARKSLPTDPTDPDDLAEVHRIQGWLAEHEKTLAERTAVAGNSEPS